MFRVTVCLLACIVALTIVTCEPILILRWGIGHQCKARGFPGACRIQNDYDGALMCSSLRCGQWNKKKSSYDPIYTGPVRNGTPCGYEEVCIDRECVPRNPSDPVLYYDDGPIVNCGLLRRMKISGPPPRIVMRRPWLVHRVPVDRY